MRSTRSRPSIASARSSVNRTSQRRCSVPWSGWWRAEVLEWAGMFSLAYDKGHKVLRARFEGVMSSQDVDELDRAVIAFTAREGPTHGLVDFSAVDVVSIPPGILARRSQQPPFNPGYKRVFVVSPAAVEL